MHDAELVRVCVQGDGAAFAGLVRRHQGPLRAWLRRLLQGDGHQADDLAQETFLRAFRALSGWRGDATFRSWLFRIGLSVWQDHCRRPSLWTVPLDDAETTSSGVAESPSACAHASAPGDGWVHQIALSLDIDRALAQLSPVQREVVLHACWADLSQAEIAQAMQLPLGTVKTHHRRAMAILARALEERG